MANQNNMDAVPMMKVNAPSFRKGERVEVYNRTTCQWEPAVVDTVNGLVGSIDKVISVAFVRWSYRAELNDVRKGVTRYQVCTAPGTDIREPVQFPKEGKS